MRGPSRRTQTKGETKNGLLFLHLASPDRAGHDHGFISREYLGAVDTAEQHLHTILSAVRASPSLTQRTTMIVTSDHGAPVVDTMMRPRPTTTGSRSSCGDAESGAETSTTSTPIAATPGPVAPATTVPSRFATATRRSWPSVC